MKTAYKNRFTRAISVLLAAVMLFGYLVIPGTVRAEEEPFRIESSRISDGMISFYQNEKPVITVSGYPVGAKFQWQIAMPGDEGWVDIMGQEEASLTLSYALVTQILDESGMTSVRCKSTCNGANDFTPPVDVKVIPGMAEPDIPAPTDAPTEPVEETTAPTDAPTEPVEETTAPTDAPTEPVAETTAPTDAPTEPEEETTAPTEAPTEPAAAVLHEVDPGAITGQTSNADGDDENIVTITIQYIYWDRHNNVEGDMVWNPYTARIKKGESLHITVDNRSRPAYTTELAADNPEGATLGTHADGSSAGISYVKLDLDNVQTDLTFKVYYKEIMVPYAARYFLQNINNDLYTEYDAYYEVFEGYQGEQPEESKIKKDVVGFSYLFEYPDTIAADGSTVFEVYYDRLYYLIDFDLDGGFGTAPVYARYETIFNVAEPEKPGYTFAGWKLIEQDGVAVTDAAVGDLPTEIPAHNQTYQAQWTRGDADYTVVYWKEKVDGTGYEHWGSKTVSATSGDLVSAADDIPDSIAKYKDATENNYEVDESLFFTFNAEKSDKDKLVLGDNSTIVNAYYDRNTYTLKFYYAMTRHPQNSDDIAYRYVIGGSTWHFGQKETAGAADKNSEVALLRYYNTDADNNRGVITSMPELNARGKQNNYTTGYDLDEDVNEWDGTFDFRYHYISFQAKYGEDIKDKWPCDVFSSVERSVANNHSNWSGMSAFVSAWNGEYNVWYSRHIWNPTVKGKYEKLDYRILWEGKNPEDMTVTYLCFWENGASIGWSVPEMWYYRQWVEVLESDDTSILTTQKVGDVTYKLADQYPTCDDSGTSGQTQVALEGFSVGRPRSLLEENLYSQDTYAREYLDNIPETKKILLDFYTPLYPGLTRDQVQQQLEADYKYFHVVDFFYKRNVYDLEYYNYNATYETKQIPYQTPLGSSYNITPSYPNDLEKNAYEFKGWYTSPHCDPDTRFTFTTETMPASDLTLYANWQPITHTVRFYLDYDQFEEKKTHGIVDNIKHNTVMVTTYPLTPSHPDHTDYRFVQWFYIQDGQKVAFEPSKMEVKKDLDLYAEWTSTATTQYTIRYLEKGTDRELATPTTGYAFVATTKTFTAKPAPDLDQLDVAERNQLWLPATNSHSILMKSEAEENTFTFYYEVKENAPYTVYYKDKDTGRELGPSDYFDPNDNAIVTPRFKYFEDYVPDAFYKRLVLSANEDENKVTFYYTKVKEGEGAYFVGHYIENLGADGKPDGTYSEYFSETRTGKINDRVTEPALSIAGYVYDPDISVDSGVITLGDGTNGDNGLELKLYYTPQKYGYTVRYLDSATNQPVYNPYISETEHYFGSTVSADAVTVNGYDLAGDETTKELVIGAVEDRNVITFYYVKKPVVINYKVTSTELPGSACGTLSRSYETPQDYTKDIQGCTADPNAGFRFLGWYYDEACTKPVPNSAGTEFTPATKDIEEGTKENIYEFTYYARFEPITLIITKSGEGIDRNDTFLFRVKGTYTDVDITVSIQGIGSVTLAPIPVDTYTVTELSGWSWTYSVDPAGSDTMSVRIAESGDTLEYKAEFRNTPRDYDWLHSETHKENPYDHRIKEEP